MFWTILFRTCSLFALQIFIATTCLYTKITSVYGPAAVKVPGVLVDRTLKPVRSGMMSRLQTPSITVFVFNGNKT